MLYKRRVEMGAFAVDKASLVALAITARTVTRQTFPSRSFYALNSKSWSVPSALPQSAPPCEKPETLVNVGGYKLEEENVQYLCLGLLAISCSCYLTITSTVISSAAAAFELNK